MARVSRLLSAVCLGIAVTAAVGAAAVGGEYTHVRRSPAQLAESSGSARVVVKFKQHASILSASGSSSRSANVGSGPQRATVLGSRLGLALTDGRALGERTQVVKASGMTSSALAAALAADGEVEWAEVDRKSFIQSAVNDPLYPDNLAATTPASGQWYLRAPGVDASGRNVVSSINIEPAWAITKGSTAIVIGDVDTGITAHPDLNSKMLTGYDFIVDTPTANDSTGRDADPSDPGDYVTATENSTKGGAFFGCNDNGAGAAIAENSSWHGTQTAGILGAATNNGVGMAGSAYAVPVISARALGKCGGYESDIIAAAQWAGGIAVSGVPTNTHPARVINMSLGGTGACSLLYVDGLTALRNRGVVVVAAAGNDEGLPVGTPANCKPAATDADQTPIVIAVAGLRHAGTKVGYSDIGTEVTIAAPAGNCVNSTVSSATPCLYPIVTATNSGKTTPVTGGGKYSDGLDYSAGTSFATPLVTGTVALMLSANPSLTNADVIRILKATARPFPTVSDSSPPPPVCTAPSATSAAQDECICTTSTCGAGMLDAGKAVAQVYAESGGAVFGPDARITASATTLAVGGTLTLSGTDSTTGSTGAAIASYQWSLPDNDAHVTLSSTTASSIVITGAAAGLTNVQLVITDANGSTSSATTQFTVTAATPSGGGSTSGSGGGGGGAANPAWLLALVLAGLALGPRGRGKRA